MQTPRISKDGLSANELANWLPALLISLTLTVGCGKKTEEVSQPIENGGGTEEPAQPGSSETNAPAVQPNTETPETKPEAPETKPEAPEVKPEAPETQPQTKAKLPLPANAKHLPANSDLLVSFKLADLLEKGGYEQLLASPMLAPLMEEFGDPTLQKLIKDPANSGLNTAEPIHIFLDVQPPANPEDPFSTPLVKGGLVASVKDADAVSGLMALLIESADVPLELKNGEAYKSVAAPEAAGVPATFGWSDDTLIFVASSDPKDAATIGQTLADRFAGKDALAKDSKSAALLQSPYDIAAWLNYETLMEMLQEMAGPLAGEVPFAGLTDKFAKDLAYALAVRFEKGSVDMDLTYHFNPELYGDQPFTKGGLDEKLPPLVPENAIVAIAEAVNMKLLRELMNKMLIPEFRKEAEVNQMITQFENALGLKLEDILEIPKGDFIAVLDDVTIGDFGPEGASFMLGLTIENKKHFNTLFNNPMVQGFMPSLAQLGIQAAQTENAFFICSQNHGPAISAGRAEKPASAAHQKLLRKDIGAYVQFDHLNGLIRKIGGAAGAPDEELEQVLGITGRFHEATMEGTFGKSEHYTLMRLTFKDKEANGLTQLVNIITEIAQFAAASAPGAAIPPDVEIALEPEAPEANPLPEEE